MYWHSHSLSNKRKIYRPLNNKIIAGVCAGLGVHFGISPNVMRGLVMLGFLINPPLVIIFYVVGVFTIPLENAAGRASDFPPPPPPDAADSGAQDLNDLMAIFDKIEDRIKILEDRVTSKEYILRRKFENL